MALSQINLKTLEMNCSDLKKPSELQKVKKKKMVFQEQNINKLLTKKEN